ncbi:MAG: TrbI/VirB10 family protein [Bacteriovoracia bacterium]
MKSYFEKVKSSISAFFFIEEGGKKVIRSKKVKVLSSVLIFLVCLIQILFTDDNSTLGKSYRPLSEEEESKGILTGSQEGLIQLESKEQAERLSDEAKSKVRQKGGLHRPKQLVYAAKQVIVPAIGEGLMTPLPSGTNFIGKLLNGIDTREPNHVAKVILPYGGRHPSGGSIPRNAVLQGTVSTNGSEKVFIRFNRVIYPNGKEFRIDAQALSSADYSPGLVGVRQSNADLRMVSSIGLTMISAGTDILTQRSMVGANPYAIGIAQPDATAQNAVLQGVSQVTKQEAQRQAQEPQSAEDYVILSPDSDLIVSLLSPYKEEME